ncbi:MAG: hypothetical protein KGV48_002150 [Alcaligenaceae bacterium]|nr:hypothetical protein [Alcaligenaceae bacterium]
MKVDMSAIGLDLNKEKSLAAKLSHMYEQLLSGQDDMTGWVHLPMNFDMDMLEDIQKTATKIQQQCSLLIVVGVGGSYLGAKAVFDALNGSCQHCPDVVFAGYDMNAAYLQKIVDLMKEQSVCLCVVSKSGSTVEPLLTYAILKQKMFEKYGREEAIQRIYVVTNETQSDLRQEADTFGFKTLNVPNHVSGRYSVLSAVGLLPIAVAGHDIRQLLQGASEVQNMQDWQQNVFLYVMARFLLYQQGKHIEIFEYFDSNLDFFGKWIVQLFAESEGKEGKGIYPTCLCFSRDLHSVGQFLQQGHAIFYETLILIESSKYDFKIPVDALAPYAGKTLTQMNRCAEQGVMAAHKKGGVPVVRMTIPCLNEYYLGSLIYFFEMSAALSAYLMGVNPFNQPGVDCYKEEMKLLVEGLEIAE